MFKCYCFGLRNSYGHVHVVHLYYCFMQACMFNCTNHVYVPKIIWITRKFKDHTWSLVHSWFNVCVHNNKSHNVTWCHLSVHVEGYGSILTYFASLAVHHTYFEPCSQMYALFEPCFVCLNPAYKCMHCKQNSHTNVQCACIGKV